MQYGIKFVVPYYKATITLGRADSSLTDAAKSGCSKEKTQTMAQTTDAIRADSGQTERHPMSSRAPALEPVP